LKIQTFQLVVNRQPMHVTDKVWIVEARPEIGHPRRPHRPVPSKSFPIWKCMSPGLAAPRFHDAAIAASLRFLLLHTAAMSMPNASIPTTERIFGATARSSIQPVQDRRALQSEHIGTAE
jgi:hypothetical protein